MKITDIRPYEKNPRLNEGAVDAVAARAIKAIFPFTAESPESINFWLNI